MTYIYIYVIICIHTLCSDTPQRYKSTSSLRYIGFYFSICLRIYSTIKQLGLNNSVVTSCECVFVTWATKFWWYQRNHDVGMVIFFNMLGHLMGYFNSTTSNMTWEYMGLSYSEWDILPAIWWQFDWGNDQHWPTMNGMVGNSRRDCGRNDLILLILTFWSTRKVQCLGPVLASLQAVSSHYVNRKARLP